MKYSVNLILWTNDPIEPNVYPIYLRITIDRKTSYVATGKFTHKDFWNEKDQQLKKHHPQAKEFNPELANTKSKAIQIIAEHQIGGKHLNAKDLKKFLTSGRDLKNLFEFAEEFASSVKNKRDKATLTNYEKHLRRLEEFNGSRSLYFEDITEEYLTAYENHLRKPYKLKNGKEKVITDSYLFLLLRAVRILFNAARKKGITNHYPFSTFEMPEVDSKKKEHLTISELNKLEHFLSTTNKVREKQSALWFLFGSYSGLRVSDWHQFNHDEHVKGSRIFLRANKNSDGNYSPETVDIYSNKTKDQKALKLSTNLHLLRARDSLKTKIDSLQTLATQKAYSFALNTHGIAIDHFETISKDYWGGFSISLTNGSKKTIKYLGLTTVAKNAVNDVIGTKTAKGVGPIEPNESGEYTFDDIYLSRVVSRVTLTKIEITYMDGTKKIIPLDVIKKITF